MLVLTVREYLALYAFDDCREPAAVSFVLEKTALKVEKTGNAKQPAKQPDNNQVKHIEWRL